MATYHGVSSVEWVLDIVNFNRVEIQLQKGIAEAINTRGRRYTCIQRNLQKRNAKVPRKVRGCSHFPDSGDFNDGPID